MSAEAQVIDPYFRPDKKEQEELRKILATTELPELEQMIDGSELNPDQLTKFWKDGDFIEECYAVDAIKTYLLTPEQKQWMFDHDLSIEEMLNGRYTWADKNGCYKIYKEWNYKLRVNAFGSFKD